MVHVPIPTLVLAVLTCIPFGLAIRDTASGKYDEPDWVRELDSDGDHDDDADDDDGDDDDYREVAARREAEDLENRAALAAYEARAEGDRLERSALVQSLYGAEVASLGSAFENIVLGARIGQASVKSSSSVDLMLLDDGIATHTLFIKIQRREDGATQYAPTMCEGLERGLREAWGRHRSINSRQIWINEPSATRAIYQPDACELRYEKITEIDSWLSKSEDSLVPLWAVGKPAKLLLDRLGERTSSTIADDQITWSVRGIGAGTGPTQLAADVRNGKIVSVFASVETDPDTQSAISERVSELTGKRPSDDLVWKSIPRIAMETGAVQLFLRIEMPSRPQ